VMFPLDKPLTEESGKLVAAWADGGAPTAIGADELDTMCATLDVKSIPALESAFGTAYKRAKAVKDDKAMKKLRRPTTPGVRRCRPLFEERRTFNTHKITRTDIMIGEDIRRDRARINASRCA